MKDFDDKKINEEKPDTTYIALEPRIAFDAAMAAEVMDETAEQVAFDRAEEAVSDAETDALASALEGAPDPSKHVVFVDAGVDDIAGLLSSVPTEAELIFLDPTQDGVAQMADALVGMQNIDAIHIISHGDEGRLELGNGALTIESIAGQHAGDLAKIGTSLTEGADIFVYGCDFGADIAVVDALARATGADVAASDDLTGASARGGDWDLEVTSGDIQETSIVASNWSGILPDTTISGADLQAAAGGGSSFNVGGADGNSFTVSRSDGGTITGEAGGAGLGRDFGAAADANPGASEDYTIQAAQPLNEIALTFGFINNNIDGEDQLLNFTARDANGNIIPDAVFMLDDTSAAGGGGLFFVGQGYDAAAVTATGANGAISINGLPGSANVNGSASGILTISSASTAINTIEFERLTARQGQFATGAFGVIMTGLDYTTNIEDADGDGTPDDADLDDDNDGILDEDETVSSSDLTLNSTGLPTNTNLVTGGSRGTATLTGLYDGAVDFTGEVDNGTGGGNPQWQDGVQLRNDVGVGDYIYVQPRDTGNFPTDAAVYTYDFNDPVEDFSLTVGGLNFGDSVQFTAFYQGVEVPISAANLTAIDAGVAIVGDDTLRGNATSGGTDVDDNRGQIQIDGPIDQLVIRSGKATGSSSTATLGLTLLGFNVLTDTDGDGLADKNDLDSDNDGITDNVEAQPSQGYIAPSGQSAAMVDANNDGIDDNYAGGLTPVDTDGDGIADFRDDDSDDDGIDDIVERNDGGPTSASGGDTDGDGLLDIFEGADADDGFDANDENIDGDTGGTSGNFTAFALGDDDGDTDDDGDNALPGVQDFDYRDSFDDPDTDGDGIVDRNDVDDDNDGILDVDEREPVFVANSSTFSSSSDISNLTTTFTPATGSNRAVVVVLSSEYSPAGGAASSTNQNAVVTLGGVQMTQVAIDYGVFSGSDNNYIAAYVLTEEDLASISGSTLSIDTVNGDQGLNGYIATLDNVDQNLVVRGSTFDVTSNNWSTPPVDAEAKDALLYFTNSGSSGASFNFDQGTEIVDIGSAGSALGGALVNVPADGTYTLTGDTSTIRRSGGIVLQFQSAIDSDGDSIADHLDIDKDNDGITDTVEAQTTSGYIAPSGIGANIIDANGDGLDDNFDAGVIAGGAATGVGLTQVDTDSDSLVDTLDDDSDGDGALDVQERGGTGPSNTPAGPFNDADQDGLLDEFEGSDTADGFDVNDENIVGDTGGAGGGFTRFNLDDNDNDVAPDGSNAVPLSQDLDYRDNFEDFDGDGIADNDDIDDDNDGILDVDEANFTPIDFSAVNVNNSLVSIGNVPVRVNGTLSRDGGNIERGNSSGDLSLSSDDYDLAFDQDVRVQLSGNQSLPGSFDAGDTWIFRADGGFVIDDPSGQLTVTQIDARTILVRPVGNQLAGAGNWSIVTQEAVSSIEMTSTGNPFSMLNIQIGDVDSDGDGSIDRLDIDSDGDGITDNVEAQTTAGYIAPSGNGAGIIDGNNNGLDDNYEVAPGTAGFNADGIGLDAVDSDADGVADYLDLDSDNDTASDLSEAGHANASASGNDADGDGLDDAFDAVTGADVNDDDIIGDDGGADGDFTSFGLADNDGDVLPDGSNASPLQIDFAYRDNVVDIDTDGDGIVDSIDVDDDNDGILDVDEGVSAVAFTAGASANQVSGTTDVGVDVTATFGVTPSGLAPGARDDRIDNDNFTFLTDTAKLTDTDVFFSGNQITSNPTIPFTLDFSGEPVSEVYLHVNSVDQFRIAFADNPDIGFEVLSSVAGGDTPAPGLSFGDNDISSADGSVADEALDGFGAGSADGTIRFFSKSGTPISQLALQLQEAPGRSNSPEGWQFAVEVGIDSDGDGKADSRDIDKDNDGITDTVEAQATADYIAPSGIGASFVDANNDGLDDNFDAGVIAGGAATGVGLTEVDTDSDGTVDTLDADSDNDTFDDIRERGDGGPTVASGGDTDGDGLLDVFEGGNVNDGFDVNDENLDPADTNFNLTGSNALNADGSNAIPLDQDLDFRSLTDLEDDTDATEENVAVTVDVLTNDDINAVVDPTDPSTGATLALLDSAGDPVSGPLVITGEGTYEVVDVSGTPQIRFTPAPGFSGTTTPVPYGIVSGGNVVATAELTITVDALPEPVDDVFEGEEDTDLPLDITGNDDLGSGLASFTIDTLPPASQGTLFIRSGFNGAEIAVSTGVAIPPGATATLFFRPAPGYFGPVTPFDYTITDTDGDTGSATVTINIDGLPEPQPDTIIVTEDTPTPVAITANDDGGEPPFTFSLDTVPPTTQGTLTYTQDGSGNTITIDPNNPPSGLSEAEASSLIFTPAPDYTGPVDVINYTVTDNDGDSASTTATLIIDAVPDPVADVLTTPEDTSLALPITANDDAGDGLAAVIINNVPPTAEGTLSYVNGSGGRVTITGTDTRLTPAEAATLRFDPAAGFSGAVTQINYTIEDSDGDTGATTLDITVDGIPDLTADAATTQENTPVALDPLANDMDFGDGFAAAIIDTVPPASQGILNYTDDATGNTVTVAPGAELSQTEMATLGFTPANGFTGVVDQIQYSVRDIDGDIASTTIDIAVAATVDAVDDSFVVPQDTDLSLNPLANDDPGGPDAVVAITSIPPVGQGTLRYTDDTSGASVPLSSGDVLSTAEFATLVFTPATGFVGPVDPVTYTISDPLGNSDSARIDILVDGIPDAGDDVFAGEEDTPLPLSILPNDNLGDGPSTVRIDTFPPVAQGVLSYTDTNGVTQTISAPVVLSQTEAASLIFEPATDFTGPVTPFSYTVIDSDGDASSADVSIVIDANPDLLPDVINITEDTEEALPILGNDDLGDGVSTVTIDSLPPANEGVLQYVDATGSKQPVVAGAPLNPAEIATLTFDPAPNFFGAVTRFEYTVTDTDGDTATTTVDIRVDGIPEPVADVFNTDEDAPVVIDLAANDDLGDGPSTISLDSVPPTTQGTLSYTDGTTGATVSVGPLSPPSGLTPVEIGTLTFTPVADFDGSVDPIAYTVTDADGDTASTTATIVINPLPDPVADNVTTNEDTDVALDLVGNDDVGDGLANLTIDALPPASQGTLFLIDGVTGNEIAVPAGVPLPPGAVGTLFFRPAPDFSGPVAAIPYTITDTSGDSASSSVAITVDAVPDPVDDAVTTPEDTPVAINVLADNGAGADDLGSGLGSVRIDTIPPATQGALSYTDASGATQPVTAGLVLDPNEATTLVFTPAAGFNGPVAPIPYTVIDTDGDTGSAVLNITVDGLPDLAPDVYVGGPDETLDTNFIANDPDFGDGFGFVTIPTAPAPAQGVLIYTEDGTGTVITVADGEQLSQTEMATLQFDPNATFFGAVDPITYTVTDTDGDVESSTANIFIDAATDVADDTLLTKEDTGLDLNLLDNDQIADPNSTVTIGAVIPDPATQGVLSYIDDATGAPVQIAAGDTLTVTELSTVRFEPATGFTGTATSFNYTVTASAAGGGTSDTAGVTIVVDPVPEAVNDGYTTKEDTDVPMPVNANDDNGTGFASIQFTSLPPAGEGVVFYTPSGSGVPEPVELTDILSAAEAATVFFRPATDFSGDITTFQYRLTDAADPDGVQDTDVADVDIFVDAVPDPVDDAFTVDEDTPLDIDILGNDDPGDGVASVTFNTVPAAGTGTLSYLDGTGTRQDVTPGDPLTPAEAASLQFTPVLNFNGPIPPFDYQLTDTNGDTGTATVTLTINPTPDVNPDAFTTKEDVPIAIDPTVNDPDANDPTSTVTLTTPPAAQGTVSYETTPGNPATSTNLPAGAASPNLTQAQFATLVFTPFADFTGAVDPIAYTVTDASGDTATTSISIEVDAVPDPVDDAFTVDEDTPLTFSVIDNDDQGDGPATVSFAAIPDPTQGVLTYLSDAGVVTPVTPGVPLSATEAALITFTPAPNFDGLIPPLTYTLTDTNGDTGIATLTLSLNPAPDLSNDAFTVDEDTPLDFDPLANDTDLGDGPSTVEVTGPPAAQGTLSYETSPGTRTTIPAGGAVSGLTPAQFSSLRFTPAAGFDGTVDPIPYTVTDATGDTATANIFLSIDPAPDPVPDTGLVETGIPFDLDILANDDLGDGLDSVRFDLLPPASQGRLTVLDGGVRRDVVLNEALSPALISTLQFDPDPIYLGPITTFTYVVRDTSGDEAGTTVDLVVDPAPLPRSDISAPTANGSSVTIDVVANDQDDPRGDIVVPGTVQLVGTANPGDPLNVPGEGTWTVNGTTGALTFMPAPTFVGDPTPVLYTIEDDDGRRSDPVAVLADYVPLAEDDFAANQPPGPVSVDVLGNDTNGDDIVPGTVQIVGTSNPGDPLRVPGEGTWSVNRFTGAITFTPDPGFTLDPTPVQYSGSDAQGNVSNPANVGVDYAPVGRSDVISGVTPGDPVVIDVLSNDTLGDAVDPTSFQFVGTANPGDPLTVPGEGTYTYDPGNGTVTFAPAPGFAGTITPIAYTVADDEGNRTGPISITIEIVFDSLAPSDDPIAFVESDRLEMPMLSADAIIHDTATSLFSLNSNDILFGDFPILTAINGLFSLGGTTVLPTEDVPIFGGLSAPYPITMAVENVDPGSGIGLFSGLAEPLLESLHHKSNPQASYYFLLAENRMLAVETILSEQAASLRINAVSGGLAGAELTVDPFLRLTLGDAIELSETQLVLKGLTGDVTVPVFIRTLEGLQIDGVLSISPHEKTVSLELSQGVYAGFSGGVAAISHHELQEIASLQAAFATT